MKLNKESGHPVRWAAFLLKYNSLAYVLYRVLVANGPLRRTEKGEDEKGAKK